MLLLYAMRRIGYWKNDWHNQRLLGLNVVCDVEEV